MPINILALYLMNVKICLSLFLKSPFSILFSRDKK